MDLGHVLGSDISHLHDLPFKTGMLGGEGHQVAL